MPLTFLSCSRLAFFECGLRPRGGAPAHFRFGLHSGLTSDNAALPKRARKRRMQRSKKGNHIHSPRRHDIDFGQSAALRLAPSGLLFSLMAHLGEEEFGFAVSQRGYPHCRCRYPQHG